MEVLIYCNLPDCEGSRFVMQADPSYTVKRLIQSFCSENEISYRSSYVLKSRSQEEFNKKRLLSTYGIQNGDEFYLTVQDDTKWACGCSQWWVLVFICLAIGSLGIIAVSVLQSKYYDPVYSYGVGIDAGSSHTKLFVYRWITGKSNGTGIVDEIFSCPSSQKEQMPPLSAFADNASQAGEQCVRPCLERSLGVVPSQEHYRTPVLLGATAGMRMLRSSNNDSAQAIMSSVRETISSFPFHFTNPQQQAQIIEGSEEGAYSWVATNYLSGTLGFIPMGWVKTLKQLYSSGVRTIGALDMGGASTQITFQPQEPNKIAPGYNATLVLYGTTYNVYTYSYLCYGLNEARWRHLANLIKNQNGSEIIDDPCSPKGATFTESHENIFHVPCTLTEDEALHVMPQNKSYTFSGSSNTERCRQVTLKLFNISSPCPHPPCTFDGVYQPPVYDSFLAFSGFYYTVRSLNLTQFPNFTRTDYVQAMDSFCNKTLSQLPAKNRYSVKNCFNSHFIYHILVDGYGFNDSNWNSIKFDNTANGAELGWILGMMINTTNIIPPSNKVELIALPIFIILLVLFFFFLVLSFCFAVYARRWSRSDYHEIPSVESV